ncbi:MAG: type IV pilin protein [Wenzhouxiangella sp.]
MNVMTHKPFQTPARPARGFTLIELLVTVAILAIIIAVAIPSYTNYVTKANRSEGTTLVLNAAQALERCYTRFFSYDPADGCDIGLPLVSENGWYQIDAATSDFAQTTFTLRAVPQGAQATRDTLCGQFILNQRGQRDVSLSSDQAVINECW